MHTEVIKFGDFFVKTPEIPNFKGPSNLNPILYRSNFNGIILPEAFLIYVQNLNEIENMKFSAVLGQNFLKKKLFTIFGKCLRSTFFLDFWYYIEFILIIPAQLKSNHLLGSFSNVRPSDVFVVSVCPCKSCNRIRKESKVHYCLLMHNHTVQETSTKFARFFLAIFKQFCLFKVKNFGVPIHRICN